MIEWVIYYADGSRVTSETHRPEDTPTTGVEVILTRHPDVGRRVLKLSDYYGYSRLMGNWIELQDSCAAMIRAMREPILIRSGEYIPEEAFEQVLIAAQNDPDLPPTPRVKPAHPGWSE